MTPKEYAKYTISDVTSGAYTRGLAKAYLDSLARIEKLEQVAKAASDFCSGGDMSVGFSLTEEDADYYLQLRISVDALDSKESRNDGGGR